MLLLIYVYYSDAPNDYSVKQQQHLYQLKYNSFE